MPYSIYWEAPEYYHEPKDSDWFWIVGIIAGAIILLSFIYGNILLAILILVGTVSIFLHANKEPLIREVEISEKGIRIDRTFYPYLTLDSFWIEVHEHEDVDDFYIARLLVKSKKTLMPLIVIPIEYPNLDEIREFLSIFIEEEEHHEPLAHKVAEYFGF